MIGDKQESNALRCRKGHVKACDEDILKAELQTEFYGRRKSKPSLSVECFLLESKFSERKPRKCSMNVWIYEGSTPLDEVITPKLAHHPVSEQIRSAKLVVPEQQMSMKNVKTTSRSKCVNYLDIAIRAAQATDSEEWNQRRMKKRYHSKRASASKSKSRSGTRGHSKRSVYRNKLQKSNPVPKHFSDPVITMEDILPSN